jgi:hypothetical protein
MARSHAAPVRALRSGWRFLVGSGHNRRMVSTLVPAKPKNGLVGIAFVVASTLGSSAFAQGGVCAFDRDCEAEEFCNLREAPAQCAAVPKDWCETNEDCDGLVCARIARGGETPRFGVCPAEWLECADSSECPEGQACTVDVRRATELGASVSSGARRVRKPC